MTFLPMPPNLLRLLALLPFVVLAGCEPHSGGSAAPIKVGVLHSQTGVMATSEKPLIEAALMAIDEVNAQGGVAGRKIQPLVVDGQSDPAHAALQAERLIVEEGVAAIFGCWTSACRKAVKPVVEKHGHLLVYPLQYEGLEQSPNILYTGLTPNQQIIPSVAWAARHIGRRVYLVGSDYVFPRTANLIVREYAKATGISIVGERYLALDGAAVGPVVEEIARLKPDFVVNTINGDANFAFFDALQQAAASRKHGEATPKVLSFSVTETEVAHSPSAMSGHYFAWGYFQSIETRENQRFVASFQQRYGANRAIGDPMEAAYVGVHLWTIAANTASSAEPRTLLRTLGGHSFGAPQGIVTVDDKTHHLWHSVRVAAAQPDGRLKIVWSSEFVLPPRPFPLRHTQAGWTHMAATLMQGDGK